MQYQIQNEELVVTVDTFGAELKSIRSPKTNKEYLWNADPAFWRRSSPVLFPIVGSLVNKQYRYEGKTYELSQHGFARDYEFSLYSQNQQELWFELNGTEEMKKNYPFDFKLMIGYRLTKNSITVNWKVENTGSHTMYYHIGAHPAFMCPIHGEADKSGYGLTLNASQQEIIYTGIDETACMTDTKHTLTLKDGFSGFTPDYFDDGAYIIADHQISQVALTDPQGKKYVTVDFDAPLCGIWSPEHKNAPFVCIEPWYGRCDRTGFNGSLEEREYTNQAAAGESKTYQYTITITES